jgi:protein-tyrosine phosphatase
LCFISLLKINPRKLNYRKTNNKPDTVFEVENDRFFAGGYPYNPGAKDQCEVLAYLLDKGIDAFIDLTEEDELVHYKKFLSAGGSGAERVHYIRFEIEDYSVCDKETMRKIIAKINGFLESGLKVYLHSRGGVGRTGLVIGCWLKSRGCTFDDAIKIMAEMFKETAASAYTTLPDNKIQIDFIKNYS